MNTYPNLHAIYDHLYKPNLLETKFYRKYVKINASILEMGCGTGRLSMQLAKETYWKSYDCVDLSEAMLVVFRDKIKAQLGVYSFYNKLRLINADMQSFQSSQKYDLVFYSFQSIQCLPKDKIKDQIQKSRELLKKGGHLIISGFDPKHGYIDGSESINGLAVENKEILFGVNKNYQFSDNVVAYDQEVKIYNKDLFLRDVLSDHFQIANIDLPFIKQISSELGLKIKSIHDESYKRVKTNDPKLFTVVYKQV